LIQEAFTAYCTESDLRLEDEMKAEKIFRTMGKTAKIDEKYMDAITGLSGSGPAYVYLFIESLIDAGVSMGLSRPVARDLAVQTTLGAAKLAAEAAQPRYSLLRGSAEYRKEMVEVLVRRALSRAAAALSGKEGEHGES